MGYDEYEDWYEDLTEVEDYYQYLYFNAIMIVKHGSKKSGSLETQTDYSYAIHDTVYIGNSVDVNNVTLFGVAKNQTALKNAEDWKDKASIDTHFDKAWLFIGGDPGEDDDPEEDEEGGDLDELVTYIGKKPTDVLTPNSPHAYEENANEYQGPYYKTYNYSNDTT